MIIYRPNPTTDIPVVKAVETAIANGIKWIQLPTHTLDDTETKTLAESVIPICRSNDIILTLENHVETVNTLRNHGVHLMPGSMHPAFVRERLGPHAIIGMQIDKDFDIASLKNLDIDYLTLTHDINLHNAENIVDRIASNDMHIPVVIEGHYTIDDIVNSSVSGILTDRF